MAEQHPGPRYHIEPLLPRIEAGYQLLTPNLRLARQIKAEWDRLQMRQGRRVWQPIAVEPLEGWLRQQWAEACVHHDALRVVVLETGQALALWREVIARDAEQSGHSLLQGDAAAQLAHQARNNLLRWGQSVQDVPLAQEFALDPDCEAFLRWCRGFEAALAAHGLATPLDTLRLLAGAPPSREHRVLLLEFEEVAPLLRQCLTQLCRDVQEPAPVDGNPVCEARAYPDKRSELQAVARWARERHQAEPGASIAIVLSDMRGDRMRLEYLLRREFDCLGSNYHSLPVNFSTGWPLAEVPVVRDALRALQMSGEQTTPQAVVELLHSRFLRLADRFSPEAQRFVTRLFEAGQAQLSVSAVRNLAGQAGGQAGRAGKPQRDLALGAILQDIAQRRELRRRALPSLWAERFAQLLQAWGWPGDEALDSLEYQQVEEWHRQLEAYAAYDAVCPALSLADALSLLRRHCRDAMFQPQTPTSCVQVLGPLEAAGLQFDHLWLFGMQAGQWPAQARPNPFIPVSVQRRLDMPHASAEREWNFSEHLMGQYRRSTPRLYASYSRELDGAPELPSAFLEGFTWVESEVPGSLPSPWRERWQRRAVEALPDERGPAIDSDELALIRGGSALLEDQSHCPFRAFARRRLQVEPLAEPALALDAGERGALLHDALYALWGELQGSAGLAALTADAEAAMIARAVDAALEALRPARRLAVGAAYCEQERAHLQSLLLQWLAVEREREEFVVQAREEVRELSLGGLDLALRVDRVDRLADGSLLVIDYKSGRSASGDWLGERPARPQLPLYGMSGETPVAALAFAQVRPRDCRFVGLGEREAAPGIAVDIPKAMRGRSEARNWEDLQEQWRLALQGLADSFLAGEAAVDPLGPGSCTWCGLQALCRVTETVEEGP